jgi:site-specific DNA-methyltransferase (adenine-specific)
MPRRKAFDKGLKPVLLAANTSAASGDAAVALEPDQIVPGDSIQLLNSAPEAWVDLVFADPPFNIGYHYHGYQDKRDDADYLSFSREWMRAVHRCLKPSGAFVLAIGDEYVADLCVIARREIGFHMRNWIVWHYTFGQQTKKMFAKSHTHLLYFTKEKPNPGLSNITFNADDVRVKSARQMVYADARANPKGRLPDDTWFLRPQEAQEAGLFGPMQDTWFESRVCGTFTEREGWHGCQMPVAVLDRIIKACSNPGDLVLDPFNGSGTTVVSAAVLGRRYIGIDQSEAYVSFARKRLDHVLHQGVNGVPGTMAGSLFDTSRSSRVMTETDAFGRKRVPRTRAGRSAVREQG